MEKHIIYMYKLCNKLDNVKLKRFTLKWLFARFTIKILYKYYSFLLSFFYGASLPYTVKIGNNLKLNHSFHGIFISANAIIGDNCTLLQHVTIGSNQPLSNIAPKIGNNVFIGVNCNIIGETVIGDDSIIGAGTTISNSIIPNNSIVVGQKFRILSKKEKSI